MDTPGTILRREREARGIPLREIASITRIPVSALRNLEEDRFDLFPAEVFAKGFLRNYARELQISTDDVLLAYQALKQHTRHEPLAPAPAVVPPAPVTARPEPQVRETPSRASAAISALSRRARRAPRSDNPQRSAEREPVTPLVLADADGDAAAAADNSQRTFRFAYLIVFLVVVTSLGLSVLFTGTGEAEENGRKRGATPALDEDGSRWLMSDQKLTSTRPQSQRSVPAADAAGDDEEADSNFDFSDDPALADDGETETPEVAPMLPAAEPAPEADAPADPIDRWNRPAFPQDDH